MRSRRCLFRRSTIGPVDVYEAPFSGETPILEASPRGSAVQQCAAALVMLRRNLTRTLGNLHVQNLGAEVHVRL